MSKYIYSLFYSTNIGLIIAFILGSICFLVVWVAAPVTIIIWICKSKAAHGASQMAGQKMASVNQIKTPIKTDKTVEQLTYRPNSNRSPDNGQGKFFNSDLSIEYNVGGQNQIYNK